jgi:hypothetical protein
MTLKSGIFFRKTKNHFRKTNLAKRHNINIFWLSKLQIIRMNMKKILLALGTSLLGLTNFSQIFDTVGTKDYSTNAYPINNNTSTQDGSYTQMIYFPADIAADTIFGIQFESNANNNNITNSKDVEIWITETAQSSYNSSGYITTGLTKVFDGELIVDGYKIRAYFDNYHIYSGTQNLVVGILEKTPGQAAPTFFQTNVGTDKVTKMRTYNPPVALNPLSPNTGGPTFYYNPGIGSGMYGRPYTEFIMSEPCLVPTNVNFYDLWATSGKVNFNRLNAIGWDIDYRRLPTGGTTNLPLADTFGTLNLSSRYEYEVKITPQCPAYIGNPDKIYQDTIQSAACDPISEISLQEFIYSENDYFSYGCWWKKNYSSSSAISSNQGYLGGYGYLSLGSVNNIVVLPLLDDYNKKELSFYTKSYYGSSIQIGEMTNPNDASTFVSFKTVSPSGNPWLKDSTMLTSASNGKYIALRLNYTNSGGAQIDNLQLIRTPDTIIQDTICAGDSIILSNETAYSTGTYFDTLSVSSGDSIIQLNLFVYASANATFTESICAANYTSPTNKVWTINGTYYDTILASNGICDSVMTFNLTFPVDLKVIGAQSTTTCYPAGTYIDVFASQIGIDYKLYDSTTNSLISTIPGDGNTLTFGTGALYVSKTFEIIGSEPTTFTPDTAMKFGGAADRLWTGLPAGFDYTNGYTFQGWVKTSSAGFVGNGNRTIMQIAGNTGSDIECYINSVTGLLSLNHNRNNGGTGSIVRFATTGLAPATWFHVAFVYDGSTIKLYLNGSTTPETPDGGGAGTINPPLQGNSPSIQFAEFNNAPFTNRVFNGSLDDLRIWDEPITAATNTANYNTCLTGTETNLAIYFDLEEGTGFATQERVSNTTVYISSAGGSTTWSDGAVSCPILGCEKSMGYVKISSQQIDTYVQQTSNVLTSGHLGGAYQWLDCNNVHAIIPTKTNQSYTAPNGSYAVEISQNGCVDTSSCFNVNTTNINSITNENITLFPNPVNEQFSVNGINLTNVNWHITTISGQIINLSQTNNVIDTRSLSKGTYIIHIATTNNHFVTKFIKH